MDTPKPLPDHVRNRLDEADWGRIYPRLVAHACSRARSLYWRSGNKEDLAKGLQPKDLVNEAIQRVYEGRREWDPEKNPDLYKFLKDSVLSSLFNELAESEDNKKTERFPERVDNHGVVEQEPRHQAPPEAMHAHHLIRETPTPEELLLAEEERKTRAEHAKTIANGLLEAATDDPEVMAILECTMDGINTPQRISERTKIPVRQLYNAQKRLRLLVKRLQMEQQANQLSEKRLR